MAHCGRVCRRVFSVFLLRSGIFITLSLEYDVEDLKPTVYMATFPIAICGFFTLLPVFSVGLLSKDILDWIVLCWGRWEVDSSIPGLHPLDVSSSPHSSGDNQPCLQTSSSGPWRQTGVTPTSTLAPFHHLIFHLQ